MIIYKSTYVGTSLHFLIHGQAYSRIDLIITNIKKFFYLGPKVFYYFPLKIFFTLP